MFNIVQEFICQVYNVPEVIDVDAAGLQLFINTHTVSDINEELNRKDVKNFYVRNLPPCKSELLLQFWRANCIVSLWNNAHMKQLCIFSPENNEWTLDENHYLFNCFDGNQLPSFVNESLQDESGNLLSLEIIYIFW